MNPINAYLNIQNGKVVASTEPKPEPNIDMENLAKIVSGEMTTEQYVKEALKEYESSIIGEVENIKEYRWDTGNPHLKLLNGIPVSISPNHPCQVEVKAKSVTVVKI